MCWRANWAADDMNSNVASEWLSDLHNGLCSQTVFLVSVLILGVLCVLVSAQECPCSKLQGGLWSVEFEEPLAAGFGRHGEMTVKHLYNDVYQGESVDAVTCF